VGGSPGRRPAGPWRPARRGSDRGPRRPAGPPTLILP